MKELTTVPPALVFYILSLSCFLPGILQPRDSGVLGHKSHTKLPGGPSEGPDAVVKTDNSEGAGRLNTQAASMEEGANPGPSLSFPGLSKARPTCSGPGCLWPLLEE